VDLNHRPLGYEGKNRKDAMQEQQTMFKKVLEYMPLKLPPFAPFHTLFTDRTRTICALRRVAAAELDQQTTYGL